MELSLFRHNLLSIAIHFVVIYPAMGKYCKIPLF